MSIPVIQRRTRKRQVARQIESTGRPVGAVSGSWVTDLAHLKQSIILCWKCENKFKKIAQRYHYHWAENWKNYYGGVIGACDDCREMGQGRSLFIHRSYLGKSYDPD